MQTETERLTTRSVAFPVIHLARRFFGHLGAAPLDREAQDVVARLLDDAERRLFYAQSVPDQRHAYETFRRLVVPTGNRDAAETAQRAALLHDVGKATVRIGAIGRSLATVLDTFGLPLWSAAREYRNHGQLGAGLLAELHTETLIVDFAARHPDPDPGRHDPAMWQALLDADHI